MIAIGPAIISNAQPWPQYRDIIQRMRPHIIRVRTPIGFGFTPEQIEDMIADSEAGLTFVLCTEDAKVDPQQIEAELFGRGFVDVIKRHDTKADFIIELGNEPLMDPNVSIWNHRHDALRTLQTFIPHPDLQIVRWSVSIPTTLATTIDLLARDDSGCILDHVDFLCVHKYAWYDLRTDGGGGEWDAIIEYLLTRTDKNLIISEVGIDDKDTPMVEKAKRYLAWAQSLPKRIEGVCFWGIGEWQRNPTMTINAAMADVLGSRTHEPQPEPVPEPTMPYTNTSLIHSTGSASAAAIDGWFVGKGQRLARDYAPNGQYKTPPPIGASIVRLSREAGVNSDLVAAQICKESAGWQSRIVRDKNNPSGLGAVNDNAYAGAITFDSPEAGIKATIAHLLTYTKGRANPWWEFDPRADAVPQHNLGVVRVLKDLEQRWAWSPPAEYNATPEQQRYGAGIAALANDLVQFWQDRKPTEEEPSTMSLIETIGQRIRAHGIEVHDIRNRMPSDGSYSRYSGPYPTHTAVHYTAVRRSPASLEAEINSWVGHGRYHVSTQGWPGIAYTIGISLSGRVFLLGEAELWRYHAFNDNPRAFPISHDMTLGQEPTPEMLRSTETALKVLHEETPEFPNLTRANTYGHQEFGRIPGGDTRNLSTSCPGGLLPYVQQYRAGAPIAEQPEPPACIGFNETEHTVCHGFRAFWEKYGELKVFGFPITAEIQENGMTVQYFERARFEFQPGSNADDFDVILGRLGAELLAARSDE